MSRPSSPAVDTPAVTEEPLTAAAIRAMTRQEVTAVLRDVLPPPAIVTPPVPTSEAPGSSGLGELPRGRVATGGLACMCGGGLAHVTREYRAPRTSRPGSNGVACGRIAAVSAAP